VSLTQLEKSIPVNPQQPINEQNLVYQSTSKNRKWQQKRAEKEAKLDAVREGRVAKPTRRSRERKQLSARRVIPDSTDSEAAGEEELRGKSQRDDRTPAVDPWFDGVIAKHRPLKPSLQSKMKKAAMAIAGRRAVQDWQDFFRCWREKGLLTSSPTSRDGCLPLVRLQTLPAEIARFYYAYDKVKTADTATSFKAITHRCRMVQLFKLYYAAESVQIIDEVEPQPGLTRQAQRKRFLFDLLHPGSEGIRDIAKNEASKSDWNAFTSRLGSLRAGIRSRASLGTESLA
jgi:hypothetical protein